MPRTRSPNRDKARALWMESGGIMPLKDIAEELDVSEEQVRKWKCQDKWEGENKVTLPNVKGNVTKREKREKQPTASEEDDIDEAPELTEKQRLFCLYYVKTFNATQAAIKAGYAIESAHVEGNRQLRKAKVREHIKHLKGSLTQELFIDAMDVLQKYVQIAYVDATDYLEFGQREVPVMGMFGPLKDENGEIVTKLVNYVDFKESSMIDGSIIKAIKLGKDGASVKLEDRMAALNKLAQYFDLFPDNFKRHIEKAKLLLDVEKSKGGGNSNELAEAARRMKERVEGDR